MMIINDIITNVSASKNRASDNKTEKPKDNAANFNDYLRENKQAADKATEAQDKDNKVKNLDDESKNQQEEDKKDSNTDSVILLQQIASLNTSAGNVSESDAKKNSQASLENSALSGDMELQAAIDAAKQNLGNSADDEGQGADDAKQDMVFDKTILKASFDTASEKGTSFSALSIGDKLALQLGKADYSVVGRIADVEVTQNKQSGELRVLQIQLNPENLGSVEARLRIGENGLHVELRAERQETARLLADDHKMLTKALEGAGFKDDGRLSISIVDKTQQIQSSQSSNAGQGATQGDSGQNFNGQRHNFAQSGQGGQNGSNQKFEQFPLSETLSDITPEETANIAKSQRLVV